MNAIDLDIINDCALSTPGMSFYVDQATDELVGYKKEAEFVRLPMEPLRQEYCGSADPH
jgi:hypothetical protein